MAEQSRREGGTSRIADAIQRSWSHNADAWITAIRGAAIGSRRAGTDAALLRTIAECNPRRLLDVGCGEGWLARSLPAPGPDYLGIDACARLIAAARQAGGGRFCHLPYQELSRHPGLVDPGFDLLVANFSLFEERLAPALHCFRHLLVAHGKLLIQTIHPGSSPATEDGWREESFQDLPGSWRPLPWYCRSVSSWEWLLAETGFRLSLRREPRHPVTGRILSLLLVAEAA